MDCFQGLKELDIGKGDVADAFVGVCRCDRPYRHSNSIVYSAVANNHVFGALCELVIRVARFNRDGVIKTCDTEFFHQSTSSSHFYAARAQGKRRIVISHQSVTDLMRPMIHKDLKIVEPDFTRIFNFDMHRWRILPRDSHNLEVFHPLCSQELRPRILIHRKPLPLPPRKSLPVHSSFSPNRQTIKIAQFNEMIKIEVIRYRPILIIRRGVDIAVDGQNHLFAGRKLHWEEVKV